MLIVFTKRNDKGGFVFEMKHKNTPGWQDKEQYSKSKHPNVDKMSFKEAWRNATAHYSLWKNKGLQKAY